MKLFTYETDKGEYPICILVSQIQSNEIAKYYLDPHGLDPAEVILLELEHNPNKKKTPIKEIRAYISEVLVPAFKNYGVQYALCTDADYFKELAEVSKIDVNLGYVLDSAYGPKVIYLPSWKTIFYDPDAVKEKIARTIQAMVDHVTGSYVPPGNGIIHSGYYPTTYAEIKHTLQALLDMGKPLTVDIEAFSLKHYDAGIGTISFCWNQHEGVAFPVDYQPIAGATSAPYGECVHNEPVRELLKDFFTKSQHKCVYHNIAYDVYVLIYQLFMDGLCDTNGLRLGSEIMLKNWDCTKLITYLATNTTAGNKLGLKVQSQEFAGNYSVGEEIEDITKIPLDVLLKYNLIDSLSTWYVYHKHWDTLIADQQLSVYEDHFKKYTIDIIEMQLTGLPVNMDRAKEVAKLIQDEQDFNTKAIATHPIIQNFMKEQADAWVHKKNAELVKKRVTVSDFTGSFNPGSAKQLQKLLFDTLGLPIVSTTKTKQPCTDADTISTLIDTSKDSKVRELLELIASYTLHSTVLGTFMPAILNAKQAEDGWHYLYGNFNLGGTVSGRLSSSKPNLQNQPNKGKLGKLLKSCYGTKPNSDWVFCGLDFASLEDRVSALTTKDSNKLRVYIDGYDGHSIRAQAYFPEQVPAVTEQLGYLAVGDQMYKVTLEDGSVTYANESHPLVQEFLNPQ